MKFRAILMATCIGLSQAHAAGYSVPTDVEAKVKAHCTQLFLDDYDMQVFCVKEQAKAYHELHPETPALEETTCLHAHFSDSTVEAWQEDILKMIERVVHEKRNADMRPAFESVCKAKYRDLEIRKAMRDLGISDEDIASKDIPILVLMEARAVSHGSP
jgi:hypothetical protein